MIHDKHRISTETKTVFHWLFKIEVILHLISSSICRAIYGVLSENNGSPTKQLCTALEWIPFGFFNCKQLTGHAELV